MELCRPDPVVSWKPRHLRLLQLQLHQHATVLFTTSWSTSSPRECTYAKCPIKQCAFFCALDRVVDWSMGLARDLHPCYKVPHSANLTSSLPFTCYCTGGGYYELKLHKNTTAQNTNRFFLTVIRRADF